MNNEIKTGICITGVLKGYFQKTNQQYTNHFLAVVTGDYQNEFGDTVENIEKIEISGTMAPMFQQQAQELQGQAVRIWVGQKAKYGIKNGRAWGFTQTYVRRDTAIERLDSKQQLKAAS